MDKIFDDIKAQLMALATALGRDPSRLIYTVDIRAEDGIGQHAECRRKHIDAESIRKGM